MGYENPLLKLPSMKKVLALPVEQRTPFELLMRELRSEADKLAEVSWRSRKGPMAAYWRAVSTYARHVAHALSKGSERPAGDVMPEITDAHRYLAVRNYKDARGSGFEADCDAEVDSFLAHLFKVDKAAFFMIDRRANLTAKADTVEV